MKVWMPLMKVIKVIGHLALGPADDFHYDTSSVVQLYIVETR